MPFAVRSQANLHFDKENVEQRQQTINTTYNKLCSSAQVNYFPPLVFVGSCFNKNMLTGVDLTCLRNFD